MVSILPYQVEAPQLRVFQKTFFQIPPILATRSLFQVARTCPVAQVPFPLACSLAVILEVVLDDSTFYDPSPSSYYGKTGASWTALRCVDRKKKSKQLDFLQQASFLTSMGCAEVIILGDWNGILHYCYSSCETPPTSLLHPMPRPKASLPWEL